MKERAVRIVLNFFFIRRYWLLFFLLALLSFLTYRAYQVENASIREAVAVFAGGAVVITIFYAFINYEYSQKKFKHDVKSARELLSFNIAMEWQREYMTKNVNALKVFYLAHKNLLEDGKPRKFQKELDKPGNSEANSALLTTLNFVESVSLAVKQGIMDEEFIKSFFGTVFLMHYNRFISYIEYRRIAKQNHKIWENFTFLSEKWITC